MEDLICWIQAKHSGFFSSDNYSVQEIGVVLWNDFELNSRSHTLRRLSTTVW